MRECHVNGKYEGSQYHIGLNFLNYSGSYCIFIVQMAGVMARCPIQPIDTDYYFIFLYYSNKRYLFERDFNV